MKILKINNTYVLINEKMILFFKDKIKLQKMLYENNMIKNNDIIKID